jgi:hypothetical protein
MKKKETLFRKGHNYLITNQDSNLASIKAPKFNTECFSLSFFIRKKKKNTTVHR